MEFPKIRLAQLAGLSLFILIFSGCSIFQKTSKNQPDNSLVEGTWKEYWAYDEESNVTYSDEYLIATEKKKLQIQCTTHPHYKFEQVHFDGKVLELRLINERDPEDVYLIDYKFELDKTRKWLIGGASTNKGIQRNVKWEKIE